MTTVALSVFLVVHGLLHLAIWLPKPSADPATPEPPFHPDHSALLSLALPETQTHRLAVLLASAAAVVYVTAGAAVAIGGGWAVPVAVAAAVVGVALKALYFNPWLTLGLLLDAGVLVAAVTGRLPVSG